MKKIRRARNSRIWLAALLLLLTNMQRAVAFSPEGHMISGAIAYEDLRARDPRVVEQILLVMSQHPDRGSFEVAAGRTSGDERARRIFMEMARWPDDIRKGEYDHPTWHYSSTPLIDTRHPPKHDPAQVTAGSAAEAFTLGVSILRDARAPAAERAIALCWLFHLLGDIHQPLHAADGYSADHPQGDEGGNLAFVIDPLTQRPLSLHWYWDQAANRSADAAPSRAEELRAKFPRASFKQLPTRADKTADFAAWQAESYALARSDAYRSDLTSGASERLATALTPAYAANAVRVAERQVTLSGYRLTDLLVVLFPP